MGRTTNMLFRGRWLATGVLLLCAAQVAAWVLDRRAPFVLNGSHVEYPVTPGGPLRITLRAERDLSRRCDVHVTRYITDGAGFRIYLPSVALDHVALERLERQSPGESRILLQLPEDARPGAAAFGNVLSYTCNPFHRAWPIRIGYEIPFEVTP